MASHSLLYQTHHPFVFFSATISSASPSPLQPQKKTQMECVEQVALKTSISRKEKEMLAYKCTPQPFLDDSNLFAVNMQNATSSDDFLVDELLDFSNEPLAGEDEEDKPCAIISVSPKLQESPEKYDVQDFVSLSSAELGVPADDLASLEWLSHFVEDSNSEYSAPFPAGIPAEEPKGNITSPHGSALEKPVLTGPCFKTPVPAKARSKRTRTGVRVWSLGSPSLTESSSGSTSSSSSSYSLSSGMALEPTEEHPVWFEKQLVKKQKKRRTGEAAGSARRCSHCGVQKTPQWRAGPLGAKTLCNACGVRFKSGRLLPEYRPACSPTFSSELHSNHHRKVLEMRRKKELSGQAEPDLAPPVLPSFG